MRTLLGFLIGFLGGLFGMSRARQDPRAARQRVEDTMSKGLATAGGAIAAWIEGRRASGPRAERSRTVSDSLLEDERVVERVQQEWRRLGLEALVDATVVDGKLYLRGRGPSSMVDAMVATARAIPGVTEIVDEAKRE